MHEKIVILDGIRIYTGGKENLKSTVQHQIRKNQPVRIHLCNSYTISLSRKNVTLRNSLVSSDLNLPDGLPLSFLVSPLKNCQIRGMDLFQLIMNDCQFSRMKHFFYGLRQDSIYRFEKNIQEKFGKNLEFECLYAPFADLNLLNLSELRERITEFDPDFIWLGLGTPKQDLLVDFIAEWKIGAPIIIPVGAVFDFLVGQVNEAPKFLQKIGLEWLYRWSKEPKRLFLRYTKHNLNFLIVVLRHIINQITPR